jgi:hypothetical protein
MDRFIAYASLTNLGFALHMPFPVKLGVWQPEAGDDCKRQYDKETNFHEPGWVNQYSHSFSFGRVLL